MSFLERIMVQHAHPTKLVLEIVGTIWAIYFLWQQNALLGVIFGIGLPILGTVLVWGKNEEKLADTFLGKIMLMHAHPLNFLFHLIGWVPIVYGLWTHSVLYILVGITMIIVGHLWGWEKIRTM